MSFNSKNILIIPVITTVFFCISKLVEMKFIDKDIKPLKILFRDALIIFISSLTASYIYFNFSDNIQEFFNVITDTKIQSSSLVSGENLLSSTTNIFTDQPNF